MFILRYPVLCCLALVGLRAQQSTRDFCTLQPHVPCCSVPSVSLDTITVEYDVLTTDGDKKPYNVTANITWDPPTNDAGYSYSVDFSPLFTVEEIETFQGGAIHDGLRAGTCTDAGFVIHCKQGGRFEIVVDTPAVTFGDLLFGFPHRISIQVIANGTASARTQCTSGVAPDCFETTENLEYCKNQTIPFSSVPRDLTVDIELPRNNEAVIIHASWKKPLFVNGYIEYTQLRAYNTEKPSPTWVYNARIRNDTNSTTIDADNAGTFRNGGFLRGSTYDFVATPKVILPDQFGLRSPQDGNAAVERIYIPDPITTETTPSTTTRTQTTTSTSPTTPSEPKPSVWVYILVTGITVLLVFILCLLVIRLGIFRKETNKEEQTVISMRMSHHPSNVSVQPEFRDKEIMNNYDVELSEEAIGRGEFSEVFKASLNLGKGNMKKQTVAVKRSKENLNASLREEFLDEIRLMIEIGNHPNIMPLLACRTVAEPYYLITEYMKYGSLKDYLHKSSNPEIVSQDSNYDLTDLRKLQFSHQVSEGMEYLATTRFFHGDLAARNVLINEEMVAKISDFGLSNDIYAKGYVRLPEEQKRPVKWYSPEANHFGKCSTESDVWSFGVVLYEIYSGGQEPYPGMLPGEVFARVKAGYRMERPENCPNKIYIIMRDCWQYEPSDRPSFELIRQTLDEMLSRLDDPCFDPIGENEGSIDNDSSSAASADRLGVDSFIYDASLDITNSGVIPNIYEDPKLSKVNTKGADGK